jgi:DNA-binding response OmpR family regulator
MQKKLFRVLVVDDDIDLLMLLERKLQQNGYVVESAGSLSEAEYILSLFKPDLVLIDINVAGEDGRQLCWKIKHTAQAGKPKVVLMSGLYYPLNKVMLFGADDFIAKPFPPEFVQQKITSLFVQNSPVPQLVPLPVESESTEP